MKRVLFVLLWLGMCLFTQFGMSAEKTHTIDIRRDTFGFSSTSPSDYDWDEVLQGCSHRDCIPAIDQPKFIRADQASFLRGDELVIAIANDSEARAYPIRILVWHELVNDVFADIPIVVSYCPLCGSGLVFERTLDGE